MGGFLKNKKKSGAIKIIINAVPDGRDKQTSSLEMKTIGSANSRTRRTELDGPDRAGISPSCPSDQ